MNGVRPLEPIQFEATDFFYIAGRGSVFTGPYPFDADMDKVIGQNVTIKGNLFEVRGIEWNLCRRPTRGDLVGILVQAVIS